MKCMSVLLYGVEVCPLRKSHIESLQFAVNGCFMKIFDTKCKETCMDVFGCFAISIVKQSKSKFLHKFISFKKGANLYGQFVSVAKENLLHCDIVPFLGSLNIITCWFFVSLFTKCHINLFVSIIIITHCVSYLSATRFW